MDKQRTLGAILQPNGMCTFRVWAPLAEQVDLEVIPASGQSYRVPMQADEEGYYQIELPNIDAGTKYYYCLLKGKFPDPASDYQPHGSNGPSAVIPKELAPWWEAPALKDYIIYELHVGTYTDLGTFEAIIDYLDELKELGINAIEIMPVAQFSGARNWGYDGVLPYAVQNSYGGPQGLKKLIQACHHRGLAVILDVVYNHLGPEYNFLAHFAPYYSSKYSTFWGNALNYDGEYSSHVRHYFIENALHWFYEYGIDALRLDAVDAIVDASAYPFLEELADKTRELSRQMGREFYLIAESSSNDTRLIRPKEQGGFNLHAQWNDEFHHALHTFFTQEKNGFYQDYGDINHVIKAFEEGYVYSGQYSTFRKRPHGISSKTIPAEKFVVFMQNHDHVGNRCEGDRLCTCLSNEQIRLYTGLLFFSPYIPLIFMGEEYGETAPFRYFISHEDPNLIQSVREGRCKEFLYEVGYECVPDPQDEANFLISKLNHQLKAKNEHKSLWEYYKAAIHLRKNHPVLKHLSKENMTVELADNHVLIITRNHQNQSIKIVANLSNKPNNCMSEIDCQGWRFLFQSSGQLSADCQWQTSIPAYHLYLFEKDNQNG